MAKKCEICLDGCLVSYQDFIYCKNCDIYYTLESGAQTIAVLPIEDVSNTQLILCTLCSKHKDATEKQKTIRTKTFTQYLKKLKYCEECKAANRVVLKNLFYRNFLFYRKRISVYGWIEFVFLFPMFLFSSRFTILFSYLYTSFKQYTISALSLVFHFVFIMLLGDIPIVKYLYMGLLAYHVVFSKTIVFDIPQDLHGVDDLYKSFLSLSIKDKNK